MGKGNAFIAALLAYVFHGTTISALTGVTTLYVSLHSDNPTAAGDQTTNEAVYTGYTRIAVARTSGGWVIAGGVDPVAAIVFPNPTGSLIETERYWGIGPASTGAGMLMYFGLINPPIPVYPSGPAPQLSTASLITES